ncbi:hypothetical protein ACHAQH_001231 [Verticillium albo-atrum]
MSLAFGGAPLAFLTETPEDWVSNAELIIHYTTVAYRSLALSNSLGKFLQTDLPREAVQYPFLLRKIMAYSGFHFAYSHPEKRQVYLLRASRQQDLAIKGVREGLSGPVDPSMTSNFYVTSIFLILSRFASFGAESPETSRHSGLTPVGTLLEIFATISGMEGGFRDSREEVRKGPLGGMVARGPGVQSADMRCLQAGWRTSEPE